MVARDSARQRKCAIARCQCAFSLPMRAANALFRCPWAFWLSLRIFAANARCLYSFSLPLRIFAVFAHFRCLCAFSLPHERFLRCPPLSSALPSTAFRAAFRAAFHFPLDRIFAAFRYLSLVLSKRQRSKKEGRERQRSSRFLSTVIRKHKKCSQ